MHALQIVLVCFAKLALCIIKKVLVGQSFVSTEEIVTRNKLRRTFSMITVDQDIF
jgi:hypothetical protein